MYHCNSVITSITFTVFHFLGAGGLQLPNNGMCYRNITVINPFVVPNCTASIYIDIVIRFGCNIFTITSIL